jgi:hypothetical protein
MSSAAAIRVMLAKGLTLEDALAVVEAFEEQSPVDNRTANARRQARFREAKRNAKALQSVTNVTPPDRNENNAKPLQSVTNVTPLARVEDNPSTKKLSGKGRKNIGAERHATPREILLECLSPEIADGVLAHRKAKRCPLTVRAAQLLAKGFLATADPNAAADMMIERGWQGFKPEWFDNERRSNGNGQQQSGKRSIVEAGRRLTARLIAERQERELRAGSSGGEGDPPVRLLPSQRS